MIASRDLRSVLRAHLADRASSWSIGGYGAIAEFHWLPEDPAPDDPESDDTAALRVSTNAGALRIALSDDVVPHAYQNLSRHPDRWLHGVALCLPWRRARRPMRTVLTELGRDLNAVRSDDRDAVLFDMGLGLPHVEVCVRTDSPSLVKRLRAACGRSLLGRARDAMQAIKEASPHRVFVSQLGRLEVYQRIGSPDTQPPTPLGPHTHVLPRLLAARRANAESNDSPAYHRACAYLYPRHPLMDNMGHRKDFDREAHVRFTALMECWGDTAFVVEKKRAKSAMRAGVAARDYRAPAHRKARHALRIAIRELAQEIGDTVVVTDWRRRFDRAHAPRHPHLVH